MLDTIEELGSWWIPESPDQKLTGTVNFDPEKGVILDLVGCFEESGDAHDNAEYSVIHGLTSKTGPITLSKCRGEGWSSYETPHGGELITSRYVAKRMFRGMHFPHPEELLLNKVHLFVTHLHAWMGQQRLQIDHNWGEDNETENVITYRTPESIHIDADEIALDLWSGFGVKESIDNLVLNGGSWIVLTSQTGLTVEQWMEKAIHPILEFLSFATGRANGISRIRFHQAYSQKHLTDWPTGEVNVHSLLTANRRYSRNVSSVHGAFDELVYVEDLEANGEAIYANWISLMERIHSTVRLYLLARDYGDRFPFFEAQFVSVVQALESYHRQTFGDDDSNGKRIHLDTRLDQIFGEMPDIVKRVHKDPAIFTQRLVDTRTYFTHLSEAMELKRFDTQDAYSAMHALLCAIEVLILRELGLSQEESLRRVMGSQRFLRMNRIR